MRRPLRHALREWPACSRSLRAARRVFVLSDYDGTLVPIVRQPDRTRLSQATRDMLERLIHHPHVLVGVISGRSLQTLRALVPLRGLYYVGNHGAEVSGPGLRFIHPQIKAYRPVLRKIARQLSPILSQIRGAHLESKGLSLSLHWRQVPPQDVVRFHQHVQPLLRPWLLRRQIRITTGKRVVEIRAPVSWDKGRGIAWIVRHVPGPRPITLLYLGDDRTDEDAFQWVNRAGGLSIWVGRPRGVHTAARWWLVGPSEVREFLRKVLQSL